LYVIYKRQKLGGVGPSWAVAGQTNVFNLEKFLHSSLKFLHKYYLLLNNIKIKIAFVVGTAKALSGSVKIPFFFYQQMHLLLNT